MAGEKVPLIIYLPEDNVRKEEVQPLTVMFRNKGYATFAMDHRGTGESTETVRDLEADYRFFLWGEEPTVHKRIYDLLSAYDLMSGMEEVDPGKIIFMGEGVGGNLAIIAASMEPKAKGVVVVSSGGNGFGNTTPTSNMTLFHRSIDPDAYIGEISPRKVFMIHSYKDDIVPFRNGERTFSYSGEPKRFEYVNCNEHGYCDEMADGLLEGIAWVLES